MVLAAGPALIEDVRRAPEEVLSRLKPRREVSEHAEWRAHTHKEYLVPSIRVHARLVEPEGHLCHGRNPF